TLKPTRFRVQSTRASIFITATQPQLPMPAVTSMVRKMSGPTATKRFSTLLTPQPVQPATLSIVPAITMELQLAVWEQERWQRDAWVLDIILAAVLTISWCFQILLEVIQR